MTYEYPKPKTGDVPTDLNQLWETVWMTVERLNVSEQMLEERLKKMEES
jgi:chaperonin cofactor prefoldin